MSFFDSWWKPVLALWLLFLVVIGAGCGLVEPTEVEFHDSPGAIYYNGDVLNGSPDFGCGTCEDDGGPGEFPDGSPLCWNETGVRLSYDSCQECLRGERACTFVPPTQ